MSVDAIVQVAMSDEAAPFLEGSRLLPRTVPGSEQWLITIGDADVLLVRSGIGLVNAAVAATHALLGSGGAALVISAGTAGGVGADVLVGDVVVAERTVNSGADAQAFGYAPGQVPGMPTGYDAWTGALTGLPASAALANGTAFRIRRGLTVSSDAFVDDARLAAVRAAFPQALATDMESAAVAQVCHVHGIPFVSVRGISDLCGAQEFHEHVDDAADRSRAVVAAILA